MGVVIRRWVWLVDVVVRSSRYIDILIPYSWKIWQELYLAIWPPTAKIKHWRNLNLAICDCEAKFYYVILACGYGGS